ncbi:uncharacterized protein EV154DRAFT_414844, partial [Mucor mucedo]|uniref:uncharacterized protein n=1 Tax=Mucor mucedo TaxID=29922 RepID=UPI00221E3CD1
LRDAWKKLEGMPIMEARHTYVEALLRITTEAYKKNIGKEQAQEIIHSFAVMRPVEYDDTTDTDDTSNQEEDEEQDYLRDIQNIRRTSLQRPPNNYRSQRPASYPKSPSQSPIPQQRYGISPVDRNQPNPSPAYGTSSFVTTVTQQKNMPFYDNSQSIHAHMQPASNHSGSSSEPLLSYTNDTSNDRQQHNASIISLGTTTKKALEALNQEIIALNGRIDDLKKDLVERDKKMAIRKPDIESKDLSYDRWNWVTKIVVKYTGVSPMTALILILILYKSGLSGRFWQKK